MSDMIGKQILPAVESYLSKLLNNAALKKSLSANISTAYEMKNIEKLSAITEELSANAEELDALIEKLANIDSIVEQANFVRDELLPKMDVLRESADAAEAVVDAELWPLPTYGELLFGVR